MTEPATVQLDFQLEAADGTADLERSAAAVREGVAALPGVADAQARATGPARGIDPVSLGAILLTVRYAAKNSAETVASLDQLVIELRQLARDLGLPRLWIWIRREKVDVSELTADKLKEIADRAVSAGS
ncbi:MAG: hypothetical protein ACLQDY_29505 [Streptosporangiaceae bacterium]